MKSFKNRIEHLLAKPEIAQKMGQKGRQFINGDWNHREMVDKIEIEYKTLLSKKYKYKKSIN